MRVLFLTDALTIGGSEIYLREMLPRLRGLGLRPEAALPSAPGNLSIRQSLAQAGVPVYAYTHLNELPRNFDLVVASAWYPQSYRAFQKHFPSLIPLVHDQIEIFYPLGGRYLYRLGYRLLQVPNLRRARAVITVSHWAAHCLKDVHGVKQVYPVPNGVDTNRFRPPLPKEKEFLRARYNLQGPVVLVPARMSPEKNHLTVLMTARLLPKVTFLLVGTGELLQLWRGVARILNLPNVFFLGRREDMPELYRVADAMLLPTLGENQSLATLEAMASGLPVVTSRIPAQKELLENGIEGFTVPTSPWHLAHALIKALANPELGANGRKRVLREHSLPEAAARLRNVLLEIAHA
ncbi:MAG: glycosyltransferase family 4 protein [Thermus sp.]|uniref:glycosyltransferase family 4 protein n=1 Tax=Thermus sp. TaxID=275 RepID=UPI00351BA3EB